MRWDPSGERLVVSFHDSNLVALFGTRITPAGILVELISYYYFIEFLPYTSYRVSHLVLKQSRQEFLANLQQKTNVQFVLE